MPDWTKAMTQSFEYYEVDPVTWADKRRINSVKSCSISRDLRAETLGSATIDIGEDIGECYVRVYLITNQNGVREKFALATILVQTPSSEANGRTIEVSMDAYTPLLELKENLPPLGYALLEKEDIMERAYLLTREHVRAPVVKPAYGEVLKECFVTNADDTWFTFISDLIDNAKYTLDLDEMGRILFSPRQDYASLSPVCEYTVDNSSILYPSLSIKHDLYGIPNVLEVIYSTGTSHMISKIINDDPNSPTSTVSRGREITRRITNPNLVNPSQEQLDDYARRELKNLSSIEYTITYSHGYRPVRLNDCVRLRYPQAGLDNIKAKVVSQSIECRPGCKVTETAVYTNNLWEVPR